MALGHETDLLGEVGGFEGPPHLVVGGPGGGQAQVIGYGPGEQSGGLGYQGAEGEIGRAHV